VPTSIDHFDLVVSDLERSLRFYRGLLAPLDWAGEIRITGERGEEVVYLGASGPERGAVLSLREAPGDPGLPYDRYSVGIHHLAWRVDSRELVEERHRWLLAEGAEIESPPREYDYAPGYYAVFFYDPDGLKLEIVHRP
jgi:glyoxylase I family protein